MASLHMSHHDILRGDGDYGAIYRYQVLENKDSAWRVSVVFNHNNCKDFYNNIIPSSRKYSISVFLWTLHGTVSI